MSRVKGVRGGAFAAVLLVFPAFAQSQEAGPTSRAAAIRRATAEVGPSVVVIHAVRNPVRGPGGPSGAGVVVDARRGLIATTGRALFGGLRAEVVGPDGKPRPVLRVFHADPAGELLLLQVDPAAPGLVAARLGDSTALELGDDVFAVGRTWEGRLLATAGIVASGRDRDAAGSEHAPLPIDASVAVENEGGPVVDLEGRVLGIAVAPAGPIFNARPPGSLPTAIPSARVREAIAAFDEGERPTRSYLGVLLGRPGPLPTGRDVAPPGVVVLGVAKESPAERALLRRGDRITAVDGREVPDARAFQRAVGAKAIGEEIMLTVARGDETLAIPVRTAPHPAGFLAPPLPPDPPAPDEGVDPAVEERSDAAPKNGEEGGTVLPKPLP